MNDMLDRDIVEYFVNQEVGHFPLVVLDAQLVGR
jgi:hypothetical protein